MDGRDCSGRTISLLHSSDTAVSGRKYQPSQSQYFQHRAASSSCETTPSLSPAVPTPPTLSRSSSSESRHFAPISPLTPSSNSTFEDAFRGQKQPLQHYRIPTHTKRKMDDQGASMYPPLPDAHGLPMTYPMPGQIAQQLPPQAPPPVQPMYRASDSPASEPSRVSTVSTASNNKSQPKKNQYPCPMAKQFGCTDFFTTSGHAARHAKKHTGKKDAYCPECNKAFTRKDNMEQHRRTHQNGRGAARSATATTDDAKVKKATKQPPAKKIKVEPQVFEAAVEQQLADQPLTMQTMAPIAAPVAPVAPIAPPLAVQPMTEMLQPGMEQAMLGLMPDVTAAGPYFMNGPVIDAGPVPALPMAMPELITRPPLHRSNFTTSLDYVSAMAPMGMVMDQDPMHYSYPSPGLSNGLNSLALAASEHRRLSEEKEEKEEKAQTSSPQETPLTETPSKETETP